MRVPRNAVMFGLAVIVMTMGIALLAGLGLAIVWSLSDRTGKRECARGGRVVVYDDYKRNTWHCVAPIPDWDR